MKYFWKVADNMLHSNYFKEHANSAIIIMHAAFKIFKISIYHTFLSACT